jgi:hypothetical protein
MFSQRKEASTSAWFAACSGDLGMRFLSSGRSFSGDCPKRFNRVAHPITLSKPPINLDSTRSRHPSAGMATARGVKIRLIASVQISCGKHYQRFGTVAAELGPLGISGNLALADRLLLALTLNPS